ncbi:MAG: hypothetical protein O9325_05355 [Roseomonas sp.]|nr:hypothetical protein [Roseomonas sp.]
MLSERLPVPEIQLAAAVIHRALEDAATPDARLARPRMIDTPQGPRRTFTPGLKPREREEAVRFLLDGAPNWRQAREAWCEVADLCPLRLRRSALARIPDSAMPADIRRALRIPDPAPTVGDGASVIPATPMQEAA